MPTTSRGSGDIIFSVTCLPSGFCPGQKRCAVRSLRMITPGRPKPSASVKSRPASIGMRAVAK